MGGEPQMASVSPHWLIIYTEAVRLLGGSQSLPWLLATFLSGGGEFLVQIFLKGF